MEITVKSKFSMKAPSPDLKSALQPYLVFLKFLGIVHCSTRHGSNPWKDPWTLYCLLVVVYSWSILLIRWESRNVAVETIELVEYLLGLAAVLKEVTGLTALFIFALCQNGLQSIFALWAQLQFESNILKQLESRVRKASWCILGIFLLLSSVQIAAYIYSVAISYFPGTSLRKVLRILRTCGMFVSMHIIGFIVLMCVTLWLLFCEVNAILGDALRKLNGFQESLLVFDSTFRLATKIVSACDHFLAFVIGPYLLNSVSHMIFNTYLLIEGKKLPIYDALSWYWLAESVLATVIILIFPALVNIQLIQIQNRLSTSSIGLSAFGIQVLTKSLIPTVVSVYTTYIFLLIQFSGPISTHVEKDMQCLVVSNACLRDFFKNCSI